ncbi:MAG: hypothetical protein CM15mP116_09280 [Synechococcus sp.]|nr:MAG: hypothetical protein CM15mP116_09280 [Synechococcus sp.]
MKNNEENASSLGEPTGLFCACLCRARVTGHCASAMTEGLAPLPVTSTQLTKPRPAEDTLIDALRGCRDVKELKALEQRLASTTDAPPLFTWICDLLVARRISRGLAARLLFELHDGGST